MPMRNSRAPNSPAIDAWYQPCTRPQWTGSPLFLERNSPRKGCGIKGFDPYIPRLRWGAAGRNDAALRHARSSLPCRPVTRPGGCALASAQPAPLAVGARPSAWLPRGRRGAVLAGIGLAAVLAAALAWFLSVRTGSSSHIRSLAVLPLENLSGDAGQEYFADGMTDELITRLGQISALRVISRTSTMTYKGTR